MTIIKQLYLRDFRNHADSLLLFDPGLNLMLGANAQGKTAILEAIYLLITGRSFRTPHLSELIRLGEKNFHLEALFVKNEVEQRLAITFDGSKRWIVHNSTPLAQLSTLLGLIQGVIITPNDIELISGPPKGRRQFLDLHLAQMSPLYLHYLSRFYGAMKQRNALLRSRAKTTLFEPFEQLMTQASLQIQQMREQALKELYCEPLPEQLTLVFQPSLFDPHQRAKELELGVTLTGPHKEDFDILLEGKSAKAFASEGQKRAAAMSLKLAQFHALQQRTQTSPLLCVDDVGMGFDQQRLIRLTTHLKTVGQVFLTSCQPLTLLEPKQVIHVVAGTITSSVHPNSSIPLRGRRQATDVAVLKSH